VELPIRPPARPAVLAVASKVQVGTPLAAGGSRPIKQRLEDEKIVDCRPRHSQQSQNSSAGGRWRGMDGTDARDWMSWVRAESQLRAECSLPPVSRVELLVELGLLSAPHAHSRMATWRGQAADSLALHEYPVSGQWLPSGPLPIRPQQPTLQQHNLEGKHIRASKHSPRAQHT